MDGAFEAFSYPVRSGRVSVYEKVECMGTVKEVLKTKGRHVFSIPPDAPVLKALELMARKDVGALLVMRGEYLLGVFSERDYARKVVATGQTSLGTPVRSMMTDWVYAVGPDEDLETCLALMNDCHIRHLPVVEGKKVVGVISIGDLVKESLSAEAKAIDVSQFMVVKPE